MGKLYWNLPFPAQDITPPMLPLQISAQVEPTLRGGCRAVSGSIPQHCKEVTGGSGDQKEDRAVVEHPVEVR
jgi:hypothetical protein